MAKGRFKTTMYVDADVYGRLQAEAERAGRPVASLVREALARFASSRPAPLRHPFALFRSRKGDLSARVSEVVGEAVAEKFRRRRGRS